MNVRMLWKMNNILDDDDDDWLINLFMPLSDIQIIIYYCLIKFIGEFNLQNSQYVINYGVVCT